MPEGHTLHRIATGLDDAFAGRVVRTSSPQGRFAQSAALLDGTELTQARAHGKHLFLEFDGHDGGPEPRVVHVHLGLYGSFTIDSVAYVGERPPVGAVRLRLESESHVADLRGPTRCELITPDEEAAVHARLGPDPLRDVDGTRGWEAIHRSRKSIAALLMDQSVVAGVGNVYRSEVLHRHRIKPDTVGQRVKRASWEAIWADLRRLLPLGVATGRIVTLEEQVEAVEEAMAKGEPPRLSRRSSAVYKRTGEPCPRCGATVRQREAEARQLYWCGGCQRRT